MVTESGASLCAVYLGLETLADFLSTRPAPVGATINLFRVSSSGPHPTKLLDANPHDEPIKCLETVDKIFQARPATDIRTNWLPKSAPFVSFKRARQLAFEAIRTAIPTTADERSTPSRARNRKQYRLSHRALTPTAAHIPSLPDRTNERPYHTFLAQQLRPRQNARRARACNTRPGQPPSQES
jgi:hypothetical protein